MFFMTVMLVWTKLMIDLSARRFQKKKISSKWKLFRIKELKDRQLWVSPQNLARTKERPRKEEEGSSKKWFLQKMTMSSRTVGFLMTKQWMRELKFSDKLRVPQLGITQKKVRSRLILKIKSSSWANLLSNFKLNLRSPKKKVWLKELC